MLPALRSPIIARMKERTFEGPVQAGHKENAVEVPFEPASSWNGEVGSFAPGRRGLAVSYRVGDRLFTSHVVRRSGKHWLLLLPAALDASPSFAVGRTIEVTIGPADA